MGSFNAETPEHFLGVDSLVEIGSIGIFLEVH